MAGTTISCGCKKVSRGEEKIAYLLKENNIYFEREKTFENCRFIDTNRLAKFDFWVENSYIIEFDGIQHFDNNNFYYSDILIKHDKYKNNWCKKNNIPLIRISYLKLDKLTIQDLLLKEENLYFE